MVNRKSIFACLLLFCIALTIPSVFADDYPYATRSNWAKSIPVLDGQLDNVYQDFGPSIAWHITPSSPHIIGWNYVYILNNANFLYIFVDLLSDNSTDSLDTVYVYLDSNNNEAGVDFVLIINRNQALVDPRLNYTFDSSVNGVWDHVQWEIKLNLSAMLGQPEAGDVIGYMFGIYGTLDPQHYYPANDYSVLSESDESTYNKLRLATAPSSGIPGFSIIFAALGLIALVACFRVLGINQRKRTNF